MEIESLDALDQALAGPSPLAGLRLQGLDLRTRTAALLARTDLEGLVVLGGELAPELEQHLRRCRALVFPSDPHAPIDPYRATLYRPEELYEGLASAGYPATPDARATKPARRASTPPRPRSPHSSSSAGSTGPRWSPCGRPSRGSARTGPRAPYTWWTRRGRRWS